MGRGKPFQRGFRDRKNVSFEDRIKRKLMKMRRRKDEQKEGYEE